MVRAAMLGISWGAQAYQFNGGHSSDSMYLHLIEVSIVERPFVAKVGLRNPCRKICGNHRFNLEGESLRQGGDHVGWLIKKQVSN